MQPRFDAFLSYHWRDQREVEALAHQLRELGLSVFLDRWYLTPGQPWPQTLEYALATCGAVVVCIGPGDMGHWQQREKFAALDRQSREPRFPVIPVLLPDADPALGFLGQNTWVDLRSGINQTMMLAILGSAVRGEPPGPDLRERVRETLAGICPYKGLAYFREEDAAFFFGRDAAIKTLYEALKDRHFVAVVGASGSGKSSVARAGLVPMLRQDTRAPWEIVTMTPNDRPLHNLATVLVPLLIPEQGADRQIIAIGEQDKALRQGTVHIRDISERILAEQRGTERLLLIVDQWEELYTLAPESDARLFIDELLTAAAAKALTVVLTLRADFMARAVGYRPLADRLQDNQVIVGPMRREELRPVIEEPAKKLGVGFEPGLVERILEHVGDAAGRLPLLEFVLKGLWDDPARHGSSMLNSTYTAMGELDGALAQKAEEVYHRLSPIEQEALPHIFLQLVRTGAAEEATRRRACLAELDSTARAIIKSLADARLLVTGGNADSNEDTVEVAHESLISHWSRLRNWVEADRGYLLWRERLRDWREKWSEKRRSKDWLLRDAPLTEAKHWLEQRGADLDRSDREFIAASLAADRLRSLIRRGAVVCTVLILTGFSIWQYRELEVERERRRPTPYDKADWVDVPTGEFEMGSPETDKEGFRAETPRHSVRIIKAFKLSGHEVTFDEYDRFAYATHRRPPSDQGFGEKLTEKERGLLPVINVSWYDAHAYAAWLSKETGKRFRLPTEAEWEYAARAGTMGQRHWGDASMEACSYANVFDRNHETGVKERISNMKVAPHACDDEYAFTAPVKRFKPNPRSLYDMMGNVFEWVEDCGHDNYTGAPADGKAWGASPCDRRVFRGGSWGSPAKEVRSAFRVLKPPTHRDHDIGFRLAQDPD